MNRTTRRRIAVFCLVAGVLVALASAIAAATGRPEHAASAICFGIAAAAGAISYLSGSRKS